VLRNIGVDLHLMGKTREGLRYVRNGMRLSKRMGKVGFTMSALFDTGRLRLEIGDVVKSESIALQLARLAEESASKEFIAKAAYLTARIAAARGDCQRALAAIRGARDALLQAQNLFLSLQVYALEWEIAKDQKRGRDALARATSIICSVREDLESQELLERFLSRKEIADLLSAKGKKRSSRKKRHPAKQAR
jgi:hypothetical protein